MGRLRVSGRDVPIWTNHKRAMPASRVSGSRLCWRCAVCAGNAADVICQRSAKTICNIWLSVGSGI